MPPRPRLLIATPDYPPERGGIQTLVYAIARHVSRFDVRVVTLGADGDAAFDSSHPVEVRRSARPRRARLPAVGRLNWDALDEALRHRPRAVLCAHIVVSPAARAISRAFGAPFVQYLHADELRQRPRLAKFAVRRADACIAVSEHTRGMALALGGSASGIDVVPNGIEGVPASGPRRDGPPTIVTVAQLEYRYKGHDVLLRALPLVRARVPDVRWVLIGDGGLRRELEAAASELDVDGHVQFLGVLDEEERDRWLARSQVFAMPSRVPAGGLGGEGFGIAYLEAGALGLPVVAGAVGGAKDAVVDGETGVLVDPLDHVELADTLADLLLDRERCERLGRAGLAHAARFEWRAIVPRVEAVIAQAMGDR